MDKTDPPTSFGVFKPVGHTVIAFYTKDEMQSAVLALTAMGFLGSSMTRYSADEMTALVRAELLAASPLATFGYELDLVRVYGDLAKRGCGFLVVEAPTDALAAQVADLACTLKPAAAQHYGRFMIEDLTEKAAGQLGAKEAGV